MGKRAFDVIAAAILVVVTAPLFVAVAAAIVIDTPGPVFYRQERVGRHGRVFRIWKFRTMVVDAERQGPWYTAPGDPRVTRVGAFLRRTSLDELPQLFNVLAGDMSLVGPRPDVPANRSQYTDDEWRRRHSVRPGITGLAQATVRSEARPGQRKELDLSYVEQANLWLDFKILVLTVLQLIRKGGY